MVVSIVKSESTFRFLRFNTRINTVEIDS